jgi:hypothetical protein
MPIKATVNSTGKYRVAINNTQRREVRTVGILPSGQKVNYLAGLLDVDASNPDNNETLVYDAGSGKYVIKELPVINGGTF